jgi:hypothetical protein
MEWAKGCLKRSLYNVYALRRGYTVNLAYIGLYGPAFFVRYMRNLLCVNRTYVLTVQCPFCMTKCPTQIGVNPSDLNTPLP